MNTNFKKVNDYKKLLNSLIKHSYQNDIKKVVEIYNELLKIYTEEVL